MEIEFHPTDMLKEVKLSYSVAPHRPATLCTSTPSTLLYEDRFMHLCEIRYLDCSESQPKSTSVMHTQQSQILDMCCIQHNDKQLLITSRDFDGGIYAYNTDTKTLEWIVKGKLPGMRHDISVEKITTDECGRIFVCDINNMSIQMLTPEGTYLGVALTSEQIVGGKPLRLGWGKKWSCLVLASIKDGRYHLSKVYDKDQATSKKKRLTASITKTKVLGSGTPRRRLSIMSPARRIALSTPVGTKRPSVTSTVGKDAAQPQKKQLFDGATPGLACPYQCQGIQCQYLF